MSEEEKLYGREGLMIVAAVRYCIGRSYNIPCDCADWIISNWSGWPKQVKQIVRRDIEQAFYEDDQSIEVVAQHFPLGTESDRAEWERVRKLWK